MNGQLMTFAIRGRPIFKKKLTDADYNPNLSTIKQKAPAATIDKADKNKSLFGISFKEI